LIKNGTIVDGSGKPGFQGDISISGDTIISIGDLSKKTVHRVIDAETLIVSPGFIDMHTHCAGNCGGGTHRIAETKAEWESPGSNWEKGIAFRVVIFYSLWDKDFCNSLACVTCC
jgi:imidazolonepropionase-like amidohydrolase